MRKRLGEVLIETGAISREILDEAIKHQRLDRLKGCQLFTGLENEEFRDVEIANEYGLTKATFSRFAGSKWKHANSPIPDLWRNTAHVLSCFLVFRETAKSAGVWDQVEKILKDYAKRQRK